ncbi:polyketide synthase dehydratase domain-containing protein, partial [Murinocardiopsis flavida]|uniref:polyketide synthase dehydratase domain-containing protein n=1 Tax=Murinocardiopsis flavida TaxID=645275 RepID=UPI001B8074D7
TGFLELATHTAHTLNHTTRNRTTGNATTNGDGTSPANSHTGANGNATSSAEAVRANGATGTNGSRSSGSGGASGSGNGATNSNGNTGTGGAGTSSGNGTADASGSGNRFGASGGVGVGELLIHTPLILDPRTPTDLRVTVGPPDTPTTRPLTIHARTTRTKTHPGTANGTGSAQTNGTGQPGGNGETGAGAGGWIHHATATLTTDTSPDTTPGTTGTGADTTRGAGTTPGPGTSHGAGTAPGAGSGTGAGTGTGAGSGTATSADPAGNGSRTGPETGAGTHPAREPGYDFTAWPPPGAHPHDTTHLYPAMDTLGMGYGPAFQRLTRAWHRGHETFAEVELDHPEAQHAPAYTLHPALLDAALHATALPHPADQPLTLPFAWTGIHIHTPGATRARVRITPTTNNGQGTTTSAGEGTSDHDRAGEDSSDHDRAGSAGEDSSDHTNGGGSNTGGAGEGVRVELADDTGTPIATIAGLTLRPLAPDTLHTPTTVSGSAAPLPRDLLDLHWTPYTPTS